MPNQQQDTQAKRIGSLLSCFFSAVFLVPLLPAQTTSSPASPASPLRLVSTSSESSPLVEREVVVPEQTGTRPFSRIGIGFHVGTTGPGVDIASPLCQHLNLRASTDFLIDSASMEDQGVDIAMKIHMQSSRVSLDWFPRAGSFRISPLLVLGNQTNLTAHAAVPQGETLTLGGSNFVSSTTDPLRGSASVDFRRIAPGISLGFGNLAPRVDERSHRHPAHFTFPVEAGFFYVGQPTLTVDFTGSACDPSQSQSIGCEQVNQDKDFQTGLAKFETRNRKNLSYASFYPLFSTGIGYAF